MLVLVWTLGIPLGVLVAAGVIKAFYSLLFNAGEKEEK
jgi:hypothetical protein